MVVVVAEEVNRVEIIMTDKGVTSSLVDMRTMMTGVDHPVRVTVVGDMGARKVIRVMGRETKARVEVGASVMAAVEVVEGEAVTPPVVMTTGIKVTAAVIITNNCQMYSLSVSFF